MPGFWIFISIVLLVGSIYDGRFFYLPVWLLIIGSLGGLLGCVYYCLGEGVMPLEVLLRFMPGIVVLLLAYATREQIGYGDAILLMAIGGCVGCEKTLWILFVALLGTFIASVCLLVTGKARRDRRLPFVPFLLGGNMLVMLGSLVVP